MASAGAATSDSGRRSRVRQGSLSLAAAWRIRPVRWIISVGMLITAAIMAAGGFGLWRLHEDVIADTKRELQNVTTILVEHVDRALDALTMTQIAFMQEVQALDIRTTDVFETRLAAADIHQSLRGKLVSLLPVHDLIVVSARGNVVASARDWPPARTNVGDADYFTALQSSPSMTSAIGAPTLDNATGRWQFTVAHRIDSANGVFLGMLVGVMELGYFEQLFAKVDLRQGSTVALIRRDGRMLARFPQTDMSVAPSISKNTAFMEDLPRVGRHAVRFKSILDGQDRIVAGQILYRHPVALSVTLTAEAALAAWRKGAIIRGGALLLALLAIGGTLVLCARRVAMHLNMQRFELDTALDNMSHGLCMFDADDRLLVVNARYFEMMKVPQGTFAPGCTLREMVVRLSENGVIAGDPDAVIDEIKTALIPGRTVLVPRQLQDGRAINITFRLLPNGNWVTTHEDVTELSRRKTELEVENMKFDAALQNISQGLVMWDADGKLIVCNQKYAELYGLPPSLVTPGITYREILEYRVTTGLIAPSKAQQYIADRIEQAKSNIVRSHVVELADGRTVRVSRRPLPNGGGVATHEDITELRRREADLEMENMKLDAALQNMSQGLVMWDADHRLIVCNQKYAEIYGLPPEILKPGSTHQDVLNYRVAHGIIAPAKAKEYVSDRLRRAKSKQAAEDVVELADGRTVRISRRPLANGGGVATHEDITELRRREVALEMENMKFDAALQNMSQGLVMWDADGKLIVCNQKYAEIYGLTPDMVKPGTSHDDILKFRFANGIIPAAAGARYAATRAEHLQAKRPSEQLIELSDGRSILVVQRPLAHGGWISTHEDITKRRRAEAQIEHMAHHDSLTDLPNRTLLQHRLADAMQQVRRGGQMAVLYLDLDHFKSINDTLGHNIGDELLKGVAERLRTCVREGDTIARLGGDEFAIIQTGLTQPVEAATLAQRIRDALAPPYDIAGHQVPIDVSIGISLAPYDTSDPEQLLKNADMALYRSKTDGRGTYRFFEPEMDDRIKARRALELDLRNAIVNGEFELYYQPLISLERGNISSCETLLRWHHPTRGMVSPAEFIPVAEETSLINQIGEWVLRQACREAATWPKDIAVAVNLSPVQFRNRALAQMVVGALAAAGLPAQRLEIEITEAVLLQNSELTLAILRQLKELGVHIAMDDFGTGYSSLSYLRSFPFDKIKIDRSFIKGVANEDDSSAIVQAVTELAARLGIATTAEGVETEEQLAKVRALGCTEMQGYLYSQPLPAKDLHRLFALRDDKFIRVA